MSDGPSAEAPAVHHLKAFAGASGPQALPWSTMHRVNGGLTVQKSCSQARSSCILAQKTVTGTLPDTRRPRSSWAFLPTISFPAS